MLISVKPSAFAWDLTEGSAKEARLDAKTDTTVVSANMLDAFRSLRFMIMFLSLALADQAQLFAVACIRLVGLPTVGNLLSSLKHGPYTVQRQGRACKILW